MAEAKFRFDPFRRARTKIDSDKISEAREEIKEFIIEQVLQKVGSGESPIEGGAWKRSLTSGYKKRKAKESSAGFANLELTGDMLDDMDIRAVGDRSLELFFKSSESAEKADGNNRGTYGKSRGSKSKAREFVPRGGQYWHSDIVSGIEEILDQFKEDDNG